ncbi:MAG: hypothetical protein ACM3MI_01095 [Clostridiales bacterium]
MKNVYYIILLLGILFSIAKADSGRDSGTCSFGYIGGNLGLAGRQVGYSKFPLKVGGQFLYSWKNNTIKLAYNKISVFQFDNEPDSKERFHSIELCYGRLLRIGSSPLLFNALYIGASTGLSINFIDYYKDLGDAWGHRITTENQLGIPLSIFTHVNFASLLTAGLEYKYSILQKSFPSSEVNFSINVKVFEL